MIALLGLSTSAQVGIGVPTANINASAQLEVASTSKGFLPPRMTEVQKNAITSPAAGLIIYQTDGTSGLYYFDGSVWISSSNYVDLTTNQTVAGSKTFNSDVTVNGIKVGKGNSSESTNTILGYNVLNSITSGGSNVAIGYQSLYSNTVANNNTSVGVNSMYKNISGGGNVAFGQTSLYNNTSGSENAAFGAYALVGNTTGEKNIGVGQGALGTNETGSNNTAIGYAADVTTNGLTNATAIGYQATVNASNKIQLGNTSVTSVNTSATITGAGFKTPSGTSSQYLKADGSTSSLNLSDYATTNALNNEITRAETAEATLAPKAFPVFSGNITTPSVSFNAGSWQIGPNGNDFTIYKGGCCNFITVDEAGRMGIGGNYSPSYPLDVQGEGRFTSALRATSFIKTGGTSSQYLMADGSTSALDLSGYATTTALNTEVSRAQAAEATLTSSLATKANLASPSFTGVVTVGGASSTASAVVEVSSTTQGFLPPRMTAAQRDAISSPVAGLVLWCTNCGTNGELNVYNGTSWKNMIGGTVAAVPHYVGESFGGGKVAYILQPGDTGYEPNVEHGIIAASNTFTQNFLWKAWGPLHSPAVGATGTAIGTGLQNSKNVNLAYSGTQTGSGEIPTSLAMLYNGGGFSDWYLPSKDELLKCMLNQNAIGLLNANNSAYWTSSEYNQYNAWYCYYNFNTGEISSGYELKNGGFLVLPIRSF